MRAERFFQKGWFVASALEHYSWLISGASHRDCWFVAFALVHGSDKLLNAERHSIADFEEDRRRKRSNLHKVR